MADQCGYCQKVIQIRGKSGEADFAECDKCDFKFHQKCASLTSSEMKVFALKKTNRLMRYYCDKCSVIIDDEMDIKTSLLNLNKIVADIMRENNALKTELNEIKMSLKSSESESCTNADSHINAESFESFYSEYIDREQRSRNILIHGVEESKQTSSKQQSSDGKATPPNHQPSDDKATSCQYYQRLSTSVLVK